MVGIGGIDHPRMRRGNDSTCGDYHRFRAVLDARDGERGARALRRDYVDIFEPTRIGARVPLQVISRERRRALPPRKQRLHDAFVKFCKDLERELERRPRGPFPLNVVDRSAQHRAVVEELKRQPPPLPPAQPPSAWSGYYYIPGPTITVFTDLGWQPLARDRDFPNSS
jgi:hypothetical protein